MRFSPRRSLKRLLQGARSLAGDWDPAPLRAIGLAPNTIFDIGVGRGTKMLYESFPNAYFVLVEPIAEFSSDLQRWCKKLAGEYHLLAASSRCGALEISVELSRIEKSSLEKRTALTATGGKVERRSVPASTLDALVSGRNYQPPYALKLDVEGHEMEVIRGAAQLLCQVQFVIAEVSVARRFEDGYDFAEFVAEMAERRFFLHDLLRISRSAADGGILFMDTLFLRSPSPLERPEP